MKCYNCGNEIHEGDEFYIYSDEIYCNECMKSTEVTYYSTDNFCESYIEEDEVSECDSIEEEIERYSRRIKETKESIEELSIFNNSDWKDFKKRILEEQLKKFELMLSKLKKVD